MRTLFKILAAWRDLKAAQRGPGAYGKRQARRRAHRSLARLLRKL